MLGVRFTDGALSTVLVFEALCAGICGEVADAICTILIAQALDAGVVVHAALLIVGAVGVLRALDALVGHRIALLCAGALLTIDAADAEPARGVADGFEWIIAAHVVDAFDASTRDIALEAIGAVIVVETCFAQVIAVAFLSLAAIAIGQTLVTHTSVFIADEILSTGGIILTDGLAYTCVGLADFAGIALDVFAWILFAIKRVGHTKSSRLAHEAACVSFGTEVVVEAGGDTKALVGGVVGQALAALAACGVILAG